MSTYKNEENMGFWEAKKKTGEPVDGLWKCSPSVATVEAMRAMLTKWAKELTPGCRLKLSSNRFKKADNHASFHLSFEPPYQNTTQPTPTYTKPTITTTTTDDFRF